MPWLALLTRGKAFIGSINPKIWLYVIGGLFLLFTVVKPLKEWLADLLRDNRTTQDKADDKLDDLGVVEDALYRQNLTANARDLAYWLGELPDLTWGERNDIQSREVYELLKDMHIDDFRIIAQLYKQITRNHSDLLDDMRKYMNGRWYDRLKQDSNLI